jgi:uncharacterized protein (UPF0332 family)
MDFDWNDYLRLAQHLAQQEDEAAKRTAISRAYYYIFHLARARAIQNGCKLSYAESSHKSVWDFYIRSSDYNCKSLGLEGSRLKERRNVADYDLPFKGRLMDDVQDAMQKASAFSQRLGTLDPRQPRASA